MPQKIPSDIIANYVVNNRIRTANKKGSLLCDSIHFSKEIAVSATPIDIGTANSDELKGVSLTILPYSAAIKYIFGLDVTKNVTSLGVLPIKRDISGGYEFCRALLGSESTPTPIKIWDVTTAGGANASKTIYEVIDTAKLKDDNEKQRWEDIKAGKDGYLSNMCALGMSMLKTTGKFTVGDVVNIMYVEMSTSFMSLVGITPDKNKVAEV